VSGICQPHQRYLSTARLSNNVHGQVPLRRLFFYCIQPAGVFGGGVNSVCSKEIILLGFCIEAELQINGNDCVSCFPTMEEPKKGEDKEGDGGDDEAGDSSSNNDYNNENRNSWCLVPTEILVNAKECCSACLSILELSISCLEKEENYCPTSTSGDGVGGGSLPASSSSSSAASRPRNLSPNKRMEGSLIRRTVTAVVMVMVSLCVYC
jgi:hypothetical protein